MMSLSCCGRPMSYYLIHKECEYHIRLSRLTHLCHVCLCIDRNMILNIVKRVINVEHSTYIEGNDILEVVI